MAKRPVPWEAVSLACQMMGASLLSIHSREELRFVKERMGRVRGTHTLTYTLTHTRNKRNGK